MRISVLNRILIKIKVAPALMALIFFRTIGVYPVNSGYHDGSDQQAPAGRRADPIRAILVLALALLMTGLQPWNHGFSGNGPAIGSINSAFVMSADHNNGDRDAGIPAPGHCLFHAGCVVSLDAEASMLSVSFASDWPAFIAATDVGLRARPDPKPPKFPA